MSLVYSQSGFYSLIPTHLGLERVDQEYSIACCAVRIVKGRIQTLLASQGVRGQEARLGDRETSALASGLSEIPPRTGC